MDRLMILNKLDVLATNIYLYEVYNFDKNELGYVSTDQIIMVTTHGNEFLN